MSRPLHERLTQNELTEIGRRFVREMRRCDQDEISIAVLTPKLVELYDDAREWGGEKVKQRRASIGVREGQGFRSATA